MNHRHRKVLHSLFRNPLPSNIHHHQVESVFKEMGADLSHSGSGRLQVAFNGKQTTVHGSDHGLSKDEVRRSATLWKAVALTLRGMTLFKVRLTSSR